MYDYIIEEIAEKIVIDLNNTKLTDDINLTYFIYIVEKSLKEYWKDKIGDVWTIEDIKKVAEDNYEDVPEENFKITLTDDECIEILQTIFHNRDPEYGITWSAIEYEIGDYLNNRELKKGENE